jgi:hypothetical protein
MKRGGSNDNNDDDNDNGEKQQSAAGLGWRGGGILTMLILALVAGAFSTTTKEQQRHQQWQQQWQRPQQGLGQWKQQSTNDGGEGDDGNRWWQWEMRGMEEVIATLLDYHSCQQLWRWCQWHRFLSVALVAELEAMTGKRIILKQQLPHFLHCRGLEFNNQTDKKVRAECWKTESAHPSPLVQ